VSGTLFPAWRPDAAGRECLAMLATALQVAQPAAASPLQPRRPAQWHATLCFIGANTPGAVTPALLDAFADAGRRVPAHAFQVDRIVYWPQSGAVVALPRDDEGLRALCDATRDAIRRCGIREQQATTQPHVTLGYLGRGLPPQAWLDGIACGDDALRVDTFELLAGAGGRYDALGEWPLTGAALPAPPTQAALF